MSLDLFICFKFFFDSSDDFHKILRTPQTVYCGFDPTAQSLHIGNLLGLINLIHFQRKGHKPIALVTNLYMDNLNLFIDFLYFFSKIGSATALIGDPSGRSTERKPLDSEDIIRNTNNIQNLIMKIFSNHEKYIWSKQNQSEKELPKLT